MQPTIQRKPNALFLCRPPNFEEFKNQSKNLPQVETTGGTLYFATMKNISTLHIQRLKLALTDGR